MSLEPREREAESTESVKPSHPSPTEGLPAPPDHKDLPSGSEDSSEELSESTSSSGESESEDSSEQSTSAELGEDTEDEHEEHVDEVLPPHKSSRPDPASKDLKSRLSKLLPVLRKANADLAEASSAFAGRIDDVGDDEEHYIEMNLGLGVLQEAPRHENADIVVISNTLGPDSESGIGESDSVKIVHSLEAQRQIVSTKRKIEEIS